MDFTREPIVETVITPKEGHKLVIRSSKAIGQEEFFVDAVEIVAFGPALFFRSVEKPKAFLVPTSDYEVLEVREARMVLKHVGLERAIKIGGGKEPHQRERGSPREAPEKEIPTPPPVAVPVAAAIAPPVDAPTADDGKGEGRFERKRERRRHYRRRRGREEGAAPDGSWGNGTEEGEGSASLPSSHPEEEKIPLVPPREHDAATPPRELLPLSSSLLTSLLPPPKLVCETLALYRESEQFKDTFFFKESSVEKEVLEQPPEETAPQQPPTPPLEPPAPEMVDEELPSLIDEEQQQNPQ